MSRRRGRWCLEGLKPVTRSVLYQVLGGLGITNKIYLRHNDHIGSGTDEDANSSEKESCSAVLVGLEDADRRRGDSELARPADFGQFQWDDVRSHPTPHGTRVQSAGTHTNSGSPGESSRIGSWLLAPRLGLRWPTGPRPPPRPALRALCSPGMRVAPSAIGIRDLGDPLPASPR